MPYADDITIKSTHTNTSAAKKCIQPYLDTILAWTKHNHLTLNPDNTTCTLFTPDPAEYKSYQELKINKIALPMGTHSKVLGLTLGPETYIQQIHSQHLSSRTQTPINNINTHQHGANRRRNSWLPTRQL